jgi:hypothetical protein
MVAESTLRATIALLANAAPIPKQTVAGKLAGIVRKADVDMSPIADRVVDAMRNDHAAAQLGKS